MRHWEATRNRFTACALLSLLAAPRESVGAVFTTKLQPHTLPAWNDYIGRFEKVAPSARPLLQTEPGKPLVRDLNPNGTNADHDVPDGFIHHWIGVIVIPNATVASVRAILENYPAYPATYAPEVKAASASTVSTSGKEARYRVRLVTEQIETFGMHFAFDMKSDVEYREVNGDTLVDSRSILIRESDSGRAPYTDLLPEGEDHGIAWRLNSYWRLRQTGRAVYAECQVISLSRKPLFGSREQIRVRAHDSMLATLLQTTRAVRNAP